MTQLALREAASLNITLTSLQPSIQHNTACARQCTFGQEVPYPVVKLVSSYKIILSIDLQAVAGQLESMIHRESGICLCDKDAQECS